MLDLAPALSQTVGDATDSDPARRRRFSVADVFGMIDANVLSASETFELIDGDVVSVSPKKSRHEAVKLALNKVLTRRAPDDLCVGVETTLYLDDDTFVEPDLSLFPVRIPSADVRGTDLLLVIEVSASSLRYDRDVKGPLYARHGVPLFWLIDTDANETWIHAAPKDGRFGFIRRVAADETLTLDAVPGFVFRLADLG